MNRTVYMPGLDRHNRQAAALLIETLYVCKQRGKRAAANEYNIHVYSLNARLRDLEERAGGRVYIRGWSKIGPFELTPLGERLIEQWMRKLHPIAK